MRYIRLPDAPCGLATNRSAVRAGRFRSPRANAIPRDIQLPSDANRNRLQRRIQARRAGCSRSDGRSGLSRCRLTTLPMADSTAASVGPYKFCNGTSRSLRRRLCQIAPTAPHRCRSPVVASRTQPRRFLKECLQHGRNEVQRGDPSCLDDRGVVRRVFVSLRPGQHQCCPQSAARRIPRPRHRNSTASSANRIVPRGSP